MENLEIWDPVLNFIKISTDEKAVLDSRPLQRLRDIQQLALTSLIYPSATHKRFEHSLGVMELATRVYSAITQDKYSLNIISSIDTEWSNDKQQYWLQVLRLAALCHDIGHLPFSHAAEGRLMPDGWNHERMTAEIIKTELAPLFCYFEDFYKPIDVNDVLKIALGFKELSKIDKDIKYSDFETILAEIITGDYFGVDRIDYLLRDSYHVGVPYGHIDYYRLISCLKILRHHQNRAPTLGISESGLHVAETLMLSRYYMFSHVYLHRVRRAYDYHLEEFLKSWLVEYHGEPLFPVSIDDYLQLSDSNIIVGIQKSNTEHAKRIRERNHFRQVYARTRPLEESAKSLEPEKRFKERLIEEYGEDNVILLEYKKESGLCDFTVLERTDREVSSRYLSQVLDKMPDIICKHIFVNPDYRGSAEVLVKSMEENGGESE